VLRNAAGFAGGHVTLLDVIQKGGLAMVDMTHDRHYGWTGSSYHNGQIIP